MASDGTALHRCELLRELRRADGDVDVGIEERLARDAFDPRARRDLLRLGRHDLHQSDRAGVGDRRRLEAALLPDDRRQQIRIDAALRRLRA